MDPLTPTTSTLFPAISHIAETAAALSASLQERTGNSTSSNSLDEVSLDREKQKETVRWVLLTPERLSHLIGDGEVAVAKVEWEEVRKLLENWKGVEGVIELERQCEEILRPHE